ncbi:TrmH family RNA methyltransferase [Candidatus Similichlamydia epinepheli]|uniref:TrmH family RNA methyltransferase n=1 Tax=Candidatus Similichlamydia epinepheli TaxID=1903953 RepID=UPI000D39D760|nr:TrmH family RNA methyltransferase [Candidatus Similichlamydia epinepheli]
MKYDQFLSSQYWLRSHQNHKLKTVSKLKHRRNREKLGEFLIEGFRELSRYLESVESGKLGFATPKWVFFCSEFFVGEREPYILSRLSSLGSELFQVSSSIFSSLLSYRDSPDGLLAVAKIPNRKLWEWVPDCITRVAVLDRIEKPGNLGAILRSGDAAGLQAILLSDPVADPWNSNAVRSSLGALFTIPVFQDSSYKIHDWLRSRGYQLIGTKPEVGGHIREIDWSIPAAFLLGSEQLGLSSFWIERADHLVSIPMLGKIDSLNVSTAAAIFFFAPLIS